MPHKYDNYIELVSSSRNIEQPFYMLVDSLVGLHWEESASIPAMKKRFGEDKVVVVPRPNLAHTPDDCPYLVELAAAGEEISEEVFWKILAYSVMQTRGRNPGSRRYFCGWLQSDTDIKTLADSLANRMIFSFGNKKKVLPIHEPLYQEIIAYTAPPELHAYWLNNISQWVIPTSWQTYIKLEGRKANEAIEPFGKETLNALLEVPYIRSALVVWYEQTLKKLPHERLQQQPLLEQGLYALPKAAAYRISQQLHKALQMGIKTQEDYTVFALMHLTVHPEFSTHPYVIEALKQARSKNIAFTDALAAIDYAHWLQIIKDLNNDRAAAYIGQFRGA